MMINVEPLKRYLQAVDQASLAWESVGAAFDTAPEDQKGKLAGQFEAAERAYYRACQELAIAVAVQVKGAES